MLYMKVAHSFFSAMSHVILTNSDNPQYNLLYPFPAILPLLNKSSKKRCCLYQCCALFNGTLLDGNNTLVVLLFCQLDNEILLFYQCFLLKMNLFDNTIYR